MGEKNWNAERQIWEVDGVPCTYRVTWKSVDGGEEHTREFTDVDQGYDFYLGLQKSAQSYGATWEHLPF
jgi:hypothetical protein